jgi:hypothetical protein
MYRYHNERSDKGLSLKVSKKESKKQAIAANAAPMTTSATTANPAAAGDSMLYQFLNYHP